MIRRTARLSSVVGAIAAVAVAVATVPALAAPDSPSFGPSIEGLAAYDPQDTCSPTAKPGAVALRSLVMAAYSGTGDYGIVRDCTVGGVSEHKEGRAWDWKVDAYVPAQDAAARDLFTWLLATDSHGNRYAMARRLGIMYMIYNRHIWSAYNADAGWRAYTGSNPHTDHVHVSLSWPGAGKTTSFWASQIAARYDSDPGARAALGAATGPEQVTGDVRWRPYEKGRMYWTSAAGAKYVLEPLLRAYLDAGGHAVHGVPVTDQLPTPDGIGRFNHFAGRASVYWTPTTAAHVVSGPVREKWAATGWERGPLGYPTTDTLPTPDGAGRFNHFSKAGSIYWTPSTGAHTVLGPVREKWAASGWELGPLGYPTTDTTATADRTGRYNDFSKAGSIYWTQSSGARSVLAPLRDAWAATGRESGPLGSPTTDTTATPDGTGRYNDFSKDGSVYWTRATGARTVLAPLRDAWAATGRQTGPLGYPTTHTTRTPDGTGRFNHFSKAGSVYWTPSTGARSVHAPLRDTWAATGWELGPLGYPTTDTTRTPDGTGRFNHFSKAGSVYATASTGSHAVWGAIRSSWAASGWELGPLGYPVTGERATPDGAGRFNHFSKAGSVYWTPRTGARRVLAPARDRWRDLGWETGYLGYPTRDEYAVPDGRRTDFVGGTITVTPQGVVDRRY